MKIQYFHKIILINITKIVNDQTYVNLFSIDLFSFDLDTGIGSNVPCIFSPGKYTPKKILIQYQPHIIINP